MIKAKFSSAMAMLLNNLASTHRGGKQVFAIAVDSFLVVLSLYLAYSLRYGEIFSDFANTWPYFVVIPIATALIFSALGIYRWVIRSSNIKLFGQLFKASILSGVALLVLMFLQPSESSNSRSLFLIYALILTFFSISVRVLWMVFFDEGDQGEPVAVYGAGTNGKNLVSIFQSNHVYHPVVFIDDDPKLSSNLICGLKVLNGRSTNLKTQLERLDVRRLVLAMPSLSAYEYERKLRKVEQLGYPVLTMPSTSELMLGGVSAEEVRDVSIEDILGRGEVAPDVTLMGKRVLNKVVLITGAGGSIGSEICRQVCLLKPKQLVAFDSSEANLYQITEDIQEKIKTLGLSDFEFTPILGTVTDELKLEGLFKKYKIDTVFHAAAYKHVPIVEAQPDQGVETNIFGTYNVLNCSVQNHVSDFVLISTDKAVRPTNSMGATKRVAELVLQAYASRNHETRISMVRFGNVLGSSGSVVPKFQKQILAGGPITLTHTEVTRYFMTIPEAAQLVLQASAIARGGDVFVLDMGEPVKIEQLAMTMVRLYGKKLHRETGDPKDIKIDVAGLRPGEKMYEELFITDSHKRTEVAKIYTAEESWIAWSELEQHLQQLKTLALENDSDRIKSYLIKLAFTSTQNNTKSDQGLKAGIKHSKDADKGELLSIV